MATEPLYYGEYPAERCNDVVKWGKTSCYSYSITNTGTNPLLVSVTSSDPEFDETYEIEVGNNVNFNVPSDGVYYVFIKEVDDLLTQEVINEYEDWIYEICGMEECYIQLNLAIFCQEDDPCCTNCSKDEQAKKMEARQNLSWLQGFMTVMMMNIVKDRLTFFGIGAPDEARAMEVSNITGIMAKVQEFMKNCGWTCGDLPNNLYKENLDGQGNCLTC
jgi:hypothetical protein